MTRLIDPVAKEVDGLMPPQFKIKDSGKRHEFDSGMVRDSDDSKVDYSLVFDGPLVERLATQLTKALEKYPVRNWMKAEGRAELARFRESAVRHFVQWLRGDADEDHFAATVFNMNGYEYVKGGLSKKDDVDHLRETARAISESLSC